MAAVGTTASANLAQEPAAAAVVPQATAPLTNSSLYVGDLDREVTEAQLFEVFSQVGPVASIRVCRDAVTRRSLGYAYVNYNSALDPGAAERALEALNYEQLVGRPMRVMWSHRDPSTRRSGVGNVFIKNLDAAIDNKALHDTFAVFGEILSCKVATEPSGRSRGYGFVHYEREESAALAIDKINGMLLEGRQVSVSPFVHRAERNAEGPRFNNIFVKDLAPEVSSEQLRELFERHGKVMSALVAQDEEGRSRGFGFVTFEDPASAAAAVAELHESMQWGRQLYCARAQKREERDNLLRQKHEEARAERMARCAGMNLFVRNLSEDVDDDALRAEFAPYGTISSAKVMSEGGVSKGFGFVCFSSQDEATRAVTEMNGRMIAGKPIFVALAQRKDVRRAQLEQQYAQRLAMGSAGAARGPLAGPGGMYPPPGGQPLFYPAAAAAAARGQLPPGAAPGLLNPYLVAGPGRGLMQGRGAGPRGPLGQVMGAVPGYPRGGRGGRGMGGAPGPRGVEGLGGRGGRGPAAAGAWGAGARGPPQGPRGGRGEGEEGGAPQLSAILANASPEQQKQLLGEQLFPKVAQHQPELAAKITGMLLEMDNSELVLLIETPEALADKVAEAVEVLRAHNAIPKGISVSGEGAPEADEAN